MRSLLSTPRDTLLKELKEMEINTKVYEFPTVPLQSTKDQVTSSLINFFSSFDLYALYKPKQINGAVSLSVDYALWTLPEKLRSDLVLVESYALWLTVIWMLDGIFDSLHTRDMSEPREIMERILNDIMDRQEISLSDDKELYPRLSDYKGSDNIERLIRAFYEVFEVSFETYFQNLLPYRAITPQSFEKSLSWLLKYIDYLIEVQKPIQDLDEYAEKRLIDSAMMCISWHLAFFMGIPASTITETHEDLFKMASLLVAYHNDILSLFRDRKQHVNNLIKCLLKGIRESSSEADPYHTDLQHKEEKRAVETAIYYTNTLYRNMEDAFKRLVREDPDNAEAVGTICIHVVKGSHNWANLQERYEKGVRMIHCIKTGDNRAFDALFAEHEGIVAGDPEIRTD